LKLESLAILLRPSKREILYAETKTVIRSLFETRTCLLDQERIANLQHNEEVEEFKAAEEER